MGNIWYIFHMSKMHNDLMQIWIICNGDLTFTFLTENTWYQSISAFFPNIWPMINKNSMKHNESYIIKWPIVLNNKEACSLSINTKPSWKLVRELFNVSGKKQNLIVLTFYYDIETRLFLWEKQKIMTVSYIIICTINVKLALRPTSVEIQSLLFR